MQTILSQVTILTLFPRTVENLLSYGAIGKFLSGDKSQFRALSIRDFGLGNHKSVDDSPYGGGPGMVLRADVMERAWLKATENSILPVRTIFMSPQGQTLRQPLARRFAEQWSEHHWVILCGHYEAIDQRFLDKYVDEEVSLGDFVLTGGELASMVFLEAVIRVIPGVVLNAQSTESDSFEYGEGWLKHPQYTRPLEFQGAKVPDVLLSGDHQKIQEFRRSESLRITQSKRPDLTKK